MLTLHQGISPRVPTGGIRAAASAALTVHMICSRVIASNASAPGQDVAVLSNLLGQTGVRTGRAAG